MARTKKPKKPIAILPKHLLFINEYLKDNNATRAAKAAGYKDKSAKNMGWRLLKEPAIKAEISRLQANQLETAGITAQYVLTTIKDIIEDNKAPGSGPTKHQVALRGSELLGKHHGLWDSGNQDRQRRPHELTDKELIALGMELQAGKSHEPQTIDAVVSTITTEELT